MNAEQLLKAGQLEEAVRVLGTELRNSPNDARRRTFLFELLCFSGDFDRAGKQLDVLAQLSPAAEMGTLLYRSALLAEQVRNRVFENREYFDSPATTSLTGTLNGRRFESISDADSRIGARLEVFAGGDYLWIPFQQIESIQMSAPRRLRDLLWAPAMIRTGSGPDNMKSLEVLLPVLAHSSSKNPDNAVRLGRATIWEETPEGEAIPIGQKMLIVDGEEIPFLEIRNLEIDAVQTARC